MKQEEVEELAHSGSFPEGEMIEKIIETSISWVLLGERYAYKLKKPVKLSYLDFSTIEKRQYFCGEELRLNRRLAKEIYIDTVCVYRDGKKFTVSNGSKGKVIDHMVLMKKMPPSLQMDFMLKTGKVQAHHIFQLADKVKAFHNKTEVIYSEPDTDKYKKEFRDILSLQELLENEEKHHRYIKAAAERVTLYLDKNSHLLRERSQKGFIRDCHGDLHSGNIFLYPEPVIFDCIEFNADFRHIDILREVAFLSMDLEYFDRKDLSVHFLKHYFGKPLSPEINQLLSYHKCHLANVRAKVNLLEARQKQHLNGEKSSSYIHSLKVAKKYLELMHTFSLLLE